jgi:hypothetical protein
MPAPQKSEQRLNGIAISWGGCDIPVVRLCAACLHAQDTLSCLLAMTALLTFVAMLTVVAIRQKDRRGKHFLLAKRVCRDHMFSQALQSMAR